MNRASYTIKIKLAWDPKDADRSRELTENADGASFGSYCETFVPEGLINEDGLSHETMMEVVLERFGGQEILQEIILTAFSVLLDRSEWTTLLRAMDGILHRAESNKFS